VRSEEPGKDSENAGEHEIHLRGHLSERLRSSFKGFRSSIRPAETVLYGSVIDQAALHGLLARLRSMGMELIEVRRLPDDLTGPSDGDDRA
jgi:hypothetical protein